MHHGMLEIVTFIVISELIWLQISLLSSPTLMKETSRPHQHRNVQTFQREQYHQMTQTEETV
jgi:hypothetical protein